MFRESPRISRERGRLGHAKRRARNAGSSPDPRGGVAITASLYNDLRRVRGGLRSFAVGPKPTPARRPFCPLRQQPNPPNCSRGPRDAQMNPADQIGIRSPATPSCLGPWGSESLPPPWGAPKGAPPLPLPCPAQSIYVRASPSPADQNASPLRRPKVSLRGVGEVRR
jgi:hypothetical protein